MKKICFVVPTLMQGGMERVVVELANFYSAEGFSVCIICLFNSEIKYSLNDKVMVCMPKFNYRNSFINKIRIFTSLFYFLKTQANNSLVLGFGERFNSLTIVACKILNIKNFISDRNNPLACNGKINDKIRNIVYPFSNGIIAQTQFSKDHFLSLKLNKSIKVIPNPLKNISSFCESEEEKKVIITVGRLDSGKNHCELIDIYNDIGNFSWKLIIVGEGTLRKELEKKIEKLHLKEYITLVGASNDVDYWLNKADIFAYTSLHEGFPNALNEAMAIPLPCIAYDCPAGPSEMIIDGVNGFLIPLNEKQIFIEKLKLLMNDNELRDKLKSESFLVRKKYNIRTIAYQILDYITEV
jgi:GalNAc-alpha-(1->4)-GalNAc-alpha-(1->3)-diNAcBac-PP-undecaprenol alpha-1,4-N-acetyl-D-galactosaminyltransferase